MSKKFIVQKQLFDKPLRQEWGNLWTNSKDAHFFNSPEWFELCSKLFSENDYVVTVRDTQQLLAVLQLCKQNKFRVNTQTSPAGHFMDKLSLLSFATDSEVLGVLMNYLVSHGNFYLPEVSERDKNAIVDRYPEIQARFSDINYYLPLGDNPLQYLSKKNASKIRNKLKKNQKHLRYESFYGDLSVLETAFSIDTRSYKNEKNMATFTSSENRKIFSTLCKQLPDKFAIDLLFFQNTPVAYSIGFIYKFTYLAINTSFDNKFQSLSPGKLLAYSLIERLTKQGFKELDFGRGDSQLKKDFTPFHRNQYLIYYHHNLFARLWWQTAHNAYSGIQNNETMYSAYRQVKKIWYH